MNPLLVTCWFVLFLHYSVGSSNKFVQNCCCSVTKSCLTLCHSMDCSMPGFPVLHHPLEFAQTQVHWISDAIQISHPLSPTFPPALNLSQQQYVFKGVNSASGGQLQHQSLQWIFKVDFLLNSLVCSPCCPRDFQEPSPGPQFKSINSSAFSLLCGPTLMYTWLLEKP